MKIEVLYFDGCPNYEPTLERVHEVLRSTGIRAKVQSVHIDGPDDAKRLHFLGSPSVRVNGLDVEADARKRTDFGYSCRHYPGEGMPSRAAVEAAIRGKTHGRFAFSAPWTMAGSVFAGVLSSACCWLPLALGGAGLSAGAFGAVFDVARPYFLFAAVLLGGSSIFVKYRRSKAATCEGGICATQPRRRAFLGGGLVYWAATTVVVVAAAMPSYIGVFYPAVDDIAYASESAVDTAVVLDVEGLTCAACADRAQQALAKVSGVDSAFVSHVTRKAVVFRGDAETPVQDLLRALADVGFEGAESATP